MDSIKEPVTRSNAKTFGCLCCTSGPLSSTVNLPRTGFAPGETIPINAEIENLSNKVMTKTQAILIQKVAFHSDDRETKKIERHIQVIYFQMYCVFNVCIPYIYFYKTQISKHFISIIGSKKRKNRGRRW